MSRIGVRYFQEGSRVDRAIGLLEREPGPLTPKTYRALLQSVCQNSQQATHLASELKNRGLVDIRIGLSESAKKILRDTA